jgi:hypothetical protein
VGASSGAGFHLKSPQCSSIRPVDPAEASCYAEELWSRYAEALGPVVDVHLPAQLHDRFKEFFDRLNLGAGVPDWVLSLYAVQDGITAAHYHRRRVEEVEAAVIEACSQAVASMSPPPCRMNSSIRTSALSYEYQSYLFDLRRCFEYLAAGLLGAFGIEAPKHSIWPKAKKALAPASPQYDRVARRLEQVYNDFSTVLDGHSPRNRLAHHGCVGAGSFRIYLEPDREPHIALEGGGEELPARNEVRLARVLQLQLNLFEEAVFALLDLLLKDACGLNIDHPTSDGQ